jgi:hypothetical protein
MPPGWVVDCVSDVGPWGNKKNDVAFAKEKASAQFIHYCNDQVRYPPPPPHTHPTVYRVSITFVWLDLVVITTHAHLVASFLTCVFVVCLFNAQVGALLTVEQCRIVTVPSAHASKCKPSAVSL